jgi:DNA-binding transcriptional regulator YdaS (Cro superfamily)
MPPLKTRQVMVGDLVRALGGGSAVARVIGVSPSAVSNWQRLGRFPARTYLQIRRRLKAKGKNAPEQLWGM